MADTFDELIKRPPERLVSQFRVDVGMLFSVLQREGGHGGYAVLGDLIVRCHESEARKRRIRREAAVLFRSLRRSGIVVSIREGSTVSYALAGGDVAELLRAARRILTELLAGQSVLLAELQQADLGGPVPERGDGPAPRTVAQAGAK